MAPDTSPVTACDRRVPGATPDVEMFTCADCVEYATGVQLEYWIFVIPALIAPESPSSPAAVHESSNAPSLPPGAHARSVTP